MAQHKRYKVHRGLNYPPGGVPGAPEVRAAAGSVVDDLDPAAIEWLTEAGLIAETKEPLNRIDDTAPPAPGEEVG